MGTPSLDADTEVSPSEGTEGDQARKRVLARRDFGSHLIVYVFINAFLIAIWGVTGHGYFWPGWVIAGWGLGLVLHARETFWRRPITDEDIAKEIRRTQGR